MLRSRLAHKTIILSKPRHSQNFSRLNKGKSALNPVMLNSKALFMQFYDPWSSYVHQLLLESRRQLARACGYMDLDERFSEAKAY